MTAGKKQNLLRGDRTPSYVNRETGAAELEISAGTWDQWVKEGRLPPPCQGFPTGTPRWRWEDVDRKLSGKVCEDAAGVLIQGALRMGETARKRREERLRASGLR